MFLEQGLKFNKSIKYLDLFDVKFGNEGIQYLENCLKTNDSLKSLRLCNTHATFNVVNYFQRFVRGLPTMQVFRWINVAGIVDQKRSKEFSIDFSPTIVDDFRRIICTD